MTELYISPISAWTPESENLEKDSSPKLSFTTPLFRRRLSQLTKMTVQVVHDCLENTHCGDIKQVFTSFRGEINREFSINEQIIKDGAILPAAFSLSVFNAPIAEASIALGLKSGYSVITPSQENFASALLAACAPVLCEEEKAIMFIYADEYIREEYGDLRPSDNSALSFAFVISSENAEGYKKLDLSKIDIHNSIKPKDFLLKYSK